jgi:hypothetical protein
MLPLVLLALANSVLGARWVVSAWRHMAHADGMDESMLGMVVFLGGLATVATGLLALLLARKTRASTRRRYVLALVVSFALGVLPWFAFATIP